MAMSMSRLAPRNGAKEAAANEATRSNKNSARTKTATTIPAKQSAFGIRKLSSKLLGDRSRTSRTKLGLSIIRRYPLSPTLKGFFDSSFSGFVDFCEPKCSKVAGWWGGFRRIAATSSLFAPLLCSLVIPNLHPMTNSPLQDLTASQAMFRQAMAVHQDWLYLDHAAVAPISLPAKAAIADWADQATQSGDVHWLSWSQKVEETRLAAANLIQASPQEIALVPNTTAGLGIIAEGFPWKPGDNVVTFAHEFPSNRYPWLHLESRGVEVRTIEVTHGQVDLQKLAENIDHHTRIVAVSWVGYCSGYRLDVAELTRLAHDRGALVALDAIQGLGVFSLDVQATGVDFVAADGHKWMLGPEGAGIFFVRQEHLSRLRPQQVGWNSVARPYDFANIDLTFRPSAARFEGGSQNMAGMIALGASLKLLQAAGAGPQTSQVGTLVLQNADYLADRLVALGGKLLYPRPEDHRSGIVTLDFPGKDPQQLREQLLKKQIVCSCRGGGLRFSPHGYNTLDEMDAVARAIAQLV